jgi:DNA repair photolyase
VGLAAEPLPGFEESTSLLCDSLSLLLEAGVGVSLRTRRNVPDALLSLLGRHGPRVRVTVPLPGLDAAAMQAWEPGTGSPSQRLFAVQRLRAARIPVSVALRPLVPYVNDERRLLERLVDAAADAGARQVSASFLRLTPTIRRRLDAESLVSTRLLYGAYLERLPEGDRQRRLPDPALRQKAYEVLARAADRRGVRFSICRCADPELGRAPCLLWPEDLATETEGPRAGRRPPRAGAPRARAGSQTGLSAIAEPAPDETPDSAPRETPGTTPRETPGTTPRETPGTTPRETPGTTPRETPETDAGDAAGTDAGDAAGTDAGEAARRRPRGAQVGLGRLLGK